MKDTQGSKHHKITLEKYEANPRSCTECGSKLEYKKHTNKFCNSSCAASFNNRGKTKNLISGRFAKKSCLQCGTITNNPKFCSNSCQRQHIYETFIHGWLSGTVSGGICNDIQVSHHIKRWLKETRGEKCEICGWAEIHPVNGKIPIDIDHIDGNSRNTVSENLRFLCPNCHSLTPNFGILNKGNGRRYPHRKYMQQKPS